MNHPLAETSRSILIRRTVQILHSLTFATLRCETFAHDTSRKKQGPRMTKKDHKGDTCMRVHGSEVGVARLSTIARSCLCSGCTSPCALRSNFLSRRGEFPQRRGSNSLRTDLPNGSRRLRVEGRRARVFSVKPGVKAIEFAKSIESRVSARMCVLQKTRLRNNGGLPRVLPFYRVPN